jgi:hypothetical protein
MHGVKPLIRKGVRGLVWRRNPRKGGERKKRETFGVIPEDEQTNENQS